MSTPSLTTLFEESCDPHGYIPRRASEEVLRCLSQLVRDGEPAVVLHGPAGIGKSMLMRVLAERFEDERRVAFVPLGDAPAPELTHRLLDELSEPATDDPADALVRAASAASRGEPRLLLMVDHANLAPIASSLQLVDAAKKAAPHLTVVFAVADEDGADEFARAIAANARVTTLSFSQSMDPSEATAYVRLRLARADVPAVVREQLDDRAVAWLSEGAQAPLPREINRRAAELLRSFEEDGEAALRVRIEHEDARPPEPGNAAPSGQPRAIDPSDIPRDDAVEPHPPAFPMTPGGGQAGGGSGGGGSLGGMLLGHGPGPKPNFEIDLELGRSLSSGLLESQRPKPAQKSAVRDGKPVRPPPEPHAEEESRPLPTGAHPSTEPNRALLVAAAAITTLLMLGGFLALQSSVVTMPNEAPQQAVETTAVAPSVVPAPAPTSEQAVDPAAVTPEAAVPEPAPEAGAVAAIDPVALPTPPASPANEIEPANPDRPSLVAGPMLEPVIASEAEQRAAAAAAAAPPPRPPVSPPVAKRAPAPRQKGPLILQSGNSAQITNPGSYARLTIDVERGSEVFVDGQSIGRAPFDEIMVEMGTHTFVAEMPDGLVIEQLVDVQVGTTVVEF